MLFVPEGVDQAGVRQVIYLKDWYGAEGQGLRDQYDQLSDHLEASDAFPGFHQLDKKTFRAFTAGVAPLFEDEDEKQPAGSDV